MQISLDSLGIDVLVALAGFLIGNLVSSRVLRWILTVRSILKSRELGLAAKVGQSASATLLGSCLWLLVAMSIVYFYVRSQPWLPWLAAGIGAAVAFLTVITVFYARQFQRDNTKDVA